LLGITAACDLLVEVSDVYLRHSTVHKEGKTHTYWRLVRSVRRGAKVCQETVAQLGELDTQGRAKAAALARRITGRAEQRELFEAPVKEEVVAVRLDQVRVEDSRSFGDVWLGWTLWRALGLDVCCEKLLPHGREEIPWATMASILVIARLCKPSSELHIAEEWYRRTALEDLLDVPSEQINDDRLYRALDRLLPHKVEIEKHLRVRFGELFEIKYDLLLYDVTSVYFEGLAEKNPQAKRGHSRDHRPDCKQVCIALVVTREGIPLGYEVFDGNRVDVKTVEEIVGTMEARYGLADRVWVMDRGMMSAKNIAWLQQTKRRYLIGAPPSELKKWKDALTDDKDWTVVREGLEVKLRPGPSGTETFVLCRSAERQKKERAMHDRFATHIEEGLTRLGRRIEKAKKAMDRSPIDRQIGRLLGRNSRAAGRYDVTLCEDADAPAKLRLRWSVRSDWEERARLQEGCYVLRTNVNDWTPEELWRTYTQLTEAEAAFRIHKSDLSIRPVWHQKKGRVQAHIFVCFLAYALWKTLEQWQKRAELGNSPRTVLEELGRIQAADVVLPLASHSEQELRIRCVVRPDKMQAALLDRLGLRLPERLRSSARSLGRRGAVDGIGAASGSAM
jgi:transposase